MTPKSKIRWEKIDPYLLQAVMLREDTETAAAIVKLAERFEVSTPTLYRRIEFLGVKRIEARMGHKAVEAWQKHCKAVARLYKNSLRLHAIVVDREREVLAELKQLEQQSYSEAQVAAFLRIGVGTVQFFADVLKKLQRDTQGRFAGSELLRFVDQDSYLLSAKRLLQRNDRRGKRTA